jgi:uncharacterized membrane protein YphA (DoxX/SURF4 family)
MKVPSPIALLLRQPWFALLARVLLTCAYWTSGFGKLLDFSGATTEAAALALPHPPIVAAATIAVQLLGSVAVISGRAAWLGAGALGVFTLAASVIAHAFWRVEGIEAAHQLATFLEHLGLIGGFMLAVIMLERERGTR